MSDTEDAETSEASQRRMERIILLVLAATQFTSIVDFMIVMPLGPQLLRAFEIGQTQFGLIVSSYTIAAGAAGLVASAIIDRFPRRTAFLVLYAGFLVGTLLCGLAPTYGFLLVSRLATGAFGGILGGVSLAIIGDVFPEERRGRATGALMTGFAAATVVGVPVGLTLGTTFGWHVPFLSLAALGSPILAISRFAMPRLDAHLGKEHVHPLRSLVATFSEPSHLNSFALMSLLMVGAFCAIPYVSNYLVANVGVPENQLFYVFMAGGGLTLIFAPLVGKLADRRGKLYVYRLIVPLSAIMLIVVTNLKPIGLLVSVIAVSTLMVSNAGRMIAAMAMITGSVRRQTRGSFMSAIAAVQHFATGLGAAFGGFVITEFPARPLREFMAAGWTAVADAGSATLQNGLTGTNLGGILIKQLPDFQMRHYGTLGWIAAAITLGSLWFAGRIRVAEEEPITAAGSLAAAAEATFDVGEPMLES